MNISKMTSRLSLPAMGLAVAIGLAGQGCSGLKCVKGDITIGQDTCTMLEDQLDDWNQAAMDLLAGNQSSKAWDKMVASGYSLQQALAFINLNIRQVLQSKKDLGCGPFGT
jgi:hypothetical protein